MRQPLAWRDPWAVVTALARELGQDGLVFLDADGSEFGRHAVLGVAPLEVVICRGLAGERGSQDPFAALDRLRSGGGSWLGWLSYEAASWVEPADHWQPSDMATLRASRHDPLIHFDLHEQRLWLEGEDPGRLADLSHTLERVCPPAAEPPAPEPQERHRSEAAGAAIAAQAWTWHTPPERFAAQVGLLLERIAAGDLFQANLTACCETELAAPPDPLALHDRLRRHCPAPFGGVAIAGDEAVVSASPERFLKLGADGLVETRPIKGTRPRFADPAADAASAAALISDPKDRAENVMIVDLLRNDLGRVCVPGSIEVPQLLGLECYTQVHHLTSVVRARLRPECNVVDLLRACWPGGSISGAPKVRACRRLDGLEPVPRGPYCGSLFHLGADGRFDSSILIRSVMVKGRRLRVHAGGGIVADSDPAGEAEEMGWKIRPLLEALA